MIPIVVPLIAAAVLSVAVSSWLDQLLLMAYHVAPLAILGMSHFRLSRASSSTYRVSFNDPLLILELVSLAAVIVLGGKFLNFY